MEKVGGLWNQGFEFSYTLVIGGHSLPWIMTAKDGGTHRRMYSSFLDFHIDPL